MATSAFLSSMVKPASSVASVLPPVPHNLRNHPLRRLGQVQPGDAAVLTFVLPPEQARVDQYFHLPADGGGAHRDYPRQLGDVGRVTRVAAQDE